MSGGRTEIDEIKDQALALIKALQKIAIARGDQFAAEGLEDIFQMLYALEIE